MTDSLLYAGSKLRVLRLDNNLAELQFGLDEKGVNVFNNATVSEFGEAIHALESCEDIAGLLVSSCKGVFIAGADITEFVDSFKLPRADLKKAFAKNNENLNRFEQLPFPTVVAINGFALGGGFEMCLACDYRVMSTAAKVGLPETGLGILPSWGGTVRLPRVAGVEVAAAWIASGKHQASGAALEVGAVDAVANPDELRRDALAYLQKAISSKSETSRRRSQKTSAMTISQQDASVAVETVSAKILARVARQLAPVAATKHIVASCDQDAATALDMEADCFCELASGYQARALVGNFLNEQYVSKIAKRYAKASQADLKKAAVIGAGIMGGGIAYQNALQGMPVAMKDIQQDALDLGMSEAAKLLSKQVSRGRLTEDQSVSIQERITPTLAMEPVADANVVVEAVVENLKVKQMVLSELEDVVSEQTILVSNTSTIQIDRMAESLKRPENFAGLHFFNPVHAMPLVEVIRGEKTSEETVAAMVDYTLRLGKKPIVVNDCPAFLVNRVLFPYFLGFEMLLLEGADFQHIDRVMEEWGWPMGPAYLADVVGIDTMDHGQEVLAEDFPSRAQRLDGSSIHALYEAKRYGQKNGLGYYNYERNEKGRSIKIPSPWTIEFLQKNTKKQSDFSDEDIVMRCMLPMAIEMARCLEEEVVASAAEADMALLYGLGFPVYRGGIVRWMDEVGMSNLVAASERLEHLGEAYQVTEAMRTMALEKSSYY